MNWILGFKRTSVVVWSGLAIAVSVAIIHDLGEGATFWPTGFGLLFVCLVSPLILHKTTCWLIDGFTSDKVKGG